MLPELDLTGEDGEGERAKSDFGEARYNCAQKPAHQSKTNTGPNHNQNNCFPFH